MENIFLPSKIEFVEGTTPNEATLVIEPLFHGYGTTIGNALRRVLLNSLEGAAITSVKIKGADHEFQSVEGVLEDVLDIVLNLKLVRFKMHTDEPVKLTLKKKGEGPVTAADFEKNSDVEVVSPDQHIATVSNKSTEFDMEVTIEKGMGFNPKENRNKTDKEVGIIEIDAMYSPIRNVGYVVEDTRVGQVTDYDKVTMSIETDGSLTPQEAVEKASQILINHFQLLAGGQPETPAAEEAASEE